MNKKAPSYDEFLKLLSSAYDKAGLPLEHSPLSSFVIHATNQEHLLKEDYFNTIIYTERGVSAGKGNNTMYGPLTKQSIRVLKALDGLYNNNIPITASLIVRIIHAERTRYEDEPLRDKNNIISFTPSYIEAIRTYIKDVDFRMVLEENFTQLVGPIMEYNSNKNADALSNMLADSSVFYFCSAAYCAIDIRPSFVKSLRHLTNLLYFNLFCFTYAKGFLSDTFILQGELFVRDMLHFHMNNIPILSHDLSLDDF